MPTTTDGCMNLATAGKIVQDVVPGGPHPMDNTLMDCGLSTEDQRKVFREQIYDRVLKNGCSIGKSDIPYQATSTLREIRRALADLAD